MQHELLVLIFPEGSHPGIQSAIEDPIRLLRPVSVEEGRRTLVLVLNGPSSIANDSHHIKQDCPDKKVEACQFGRGRSD